MIPSVPRKALVESVAIALEAVSDHEFAPTAEDAQALTDFAASTPATTVGDFHPNDPEVSPGCPWHGSGREWACANVAASAFAAEFDSAMNERVPALRTNCTDVLVVG